MKITTYPCFVLAALLALPLAVRGDDLADATTIELAFVNGVYTNLDEAGMAPVERGGMTIHLRSPEHRLEIYGNRLRMAPVADGTVRAELTVDFAGEGDLVARLEGLGTSQTFEDHIEAPRQSVTVPGLIRVARVEAGYEIEIVALPPSVELDVRSGVAARLVAACRALDKIPFLRVSCDGWERALATVTVPLPGPGRRVLVPGASLTEEEKAFFELFVPIEPQPESRGE